MPNLRIMISGLCVFAFDRPLPKGKGKEPTTATLLLQRLTQARQLASIVNSQHEVLDQHFPLLCFDADDQDPASVRKPDFLGMPDATGKMTKGVCLLFGEDLTILIDGRPMKPNALSLTSNPPSNQLAPQLTGQNQETLWWMATLEDAFPGRAAINPIFINSKPGPNQPILARVNQLSEGQLKTAELTDSPCAFLPPGSASFNQRIARSFALDVPFQSKVEIVMERPNGTKVESRNLTFSPKAGKDLLIEIKNMEVNQLIGFDLAYVAPRATADFEIYAELLLSPIQGNKPFLVQKSIGGAAGVGLSNCPPTGGGG
jgi:hypothetical protein